ncbi:hypothetical protein B0I35DRAFT_463500 [Stachybotrys elegans]|uniref:Uncharacterized protein n=1 Tax=Stachybotrys elegans TaxID=80388 RepID=A0A8K0SJ20_9HYPO|nr:hypothetical protein B0I35DRAFT_463500 [Stachybotrys elegans]
MASESNQGAQPTSTTTPPKENQQLRHPLPIRPFVPSQALPQTQPLPSQQQLLYQQPRQQLQSHRSQPQPPPQLLSDDSKDLACRQLIHDAELKLRQSLPSATTEMDPHGNQYGGGSSSNSTHDSSYYTKGSKGNDQIVLDGLLPRIETRGQSRGGRHKYDDKSKGSRR